MHQAVHTVDAGYIKFAYPNAFGDVCVCRDFLHYKTAVGTLWCNLPRRQVSKAQTNPLLQQSSAIWAYRAFISLTA